VRVFFALLMHVRLFCDVKSGSNAMLTGIAFWLLSQTRTNRMYFLWLNTTSILFLY